MVTAHCPNLDTRIPMSNTPTHLQDAKDLLTENGFATSDVWYHGTSSALITSINESGINRSGDRNSNKKAKDTMVTIGGSHNESVQPVFLTQSKELAYIWAAKTVRKRSVRFEGEEMGIVYKVTLDESLNEKVKTDVGAAAMLMIEADDYLELLADIYKANGMEMPNIEPATADRMVYLNKLGMAYINTNIPVSCIELLTE
jgi:hypothetical protein